MSMGMCFIIFDDIQAKTSIINELVGEKTNDLGSAQVRHKSGCTVTEDG